MDFRSGTEFVKKFSPRYVIRTGYRRICEESGKKFDQGHYEPWDLQFLYPIYFLVL